MKEEERNQTLRQVKNGEIMVIIYSVSTYKSWLIAGSVFQEISCTPSSLIR